MNEHKCQYDPMIQSGPCQICGCTNYPLSFGGPTMCPWCDMGNCDKTVIKNQQTQIFSMLSDKLRMDWLEAAVVSGVFARLSVELKGKWEGSFRQWIDAAMKYCEENQLSVFRDEKIENNGEI